MAPPASPKSALGWNAHDFLTHIQNPLISRPIASERQQRPPPLRPNIGLARRRSQCNGDCVAATQHLRGRLIIWRIPSVKRGGDTEWSGVTVSAVIAW